jgi:hypothetical protein
VEGVFLKIDLPCFGFKQEVLEVSTKVLYISLKELSAMALKAPGMLKTTL